MSIQMKLIIGAVMLAIVGFVGWDLKTSHEMIGVLENTVKTQKDVIQGYVDKEKQDKKVDTIFDTAASKVNAGAQQVDDHQDKVENEVDAKVAAVRAKYKPLIDKARADGAAAGAAYGAEKVAAIVNQIALEQEEATEISGERFAGLWKNYCHATPASDDGSCKAPSPDQSP